VFGTAGRLAGENALRNPRRTGATASALMIGLAVVSAVGVLAASTDKTNAALIDKQFRSDFLVQSPTFQSFPTSIGDQMEGVEGVATVSRQQFTPALIGGEQASVTGNDERFDQIYQLDMVKGTQAISGDEVLVTEDVAAEHSLGVGDTLAIGFPGGKTLDLKVAGIFTSSYATGSITVPISVLEQAGLKRSDVTLSINVVEGADLAAVQAALDRVVKDLPIVSVQDKVKFTETTSGQINQLLAIIYALLALAVIIAVIGIVNTLGLSVLERTREIGLLRAVGLSRRRLRRMVTLESVAISLLGALLGMGLGLAIGVLLRQSLSEDLTELALPVGSLVAFLAVAVIFGVLAAVVPAIRASRMKVLDAIATE
jgi:putative ABC transport system permease protein